MYFILEAEVLKKVVHLIYSGDDGFGMNFFEGNPIAAPLSPEDLYVKFESASIDLPDYFEVNCVPVVNSKVIDAFVASGVDNIQIFPVPVKFQDSIIQGYSAINVVGRIKAIDLNESAVTKFGPVISRIQNLRFITNCSFDLPMFRAREYQEILFISEKVKEALSAANISGCLISYAEGWNDAHRF